jgi:hypothetical protein
VLLVAAILPGRNLTPYAAQLYLKLSTTELHVILEAICGVGGFVSFYSWGVHTWHTRTVRLTSSSELRNPARIAIHNFENVVTKYKTHLIVFLSPLVEVAAEQSDI